MNNKNTVEITLLVSNSSGVFSYLMKKGGSIGLIYRRQHSERLNADNSRIVIFFEGELTCDKKQCISTIEEHPNVIKVVKVAVAKAN